ncbi:MAG: hypothetical protein LBD25_04575 [Coriobacteriales bacterium]|jgi:Fe-S-cluster-containing dehydrogenase component|nr:hypothetical protein [Coriobacteriales bacterium]
MAKNALLIDYEYCTGCHSCEVACRNEKSLKKGEWGIKLTEYGPLPLPGDKWDYHFVPIPTLRCDLCSNRVAAGDEPACVKHCLAFCMQYGTIEEMAQAAERLGNRVAIFVP